MQNGLLLVYRQWGITSDDPGGGNAPFYYPVTCNPLTAFAGTTKLGTGVQPPNDAVIQDLGTTACTIDSTYAGYTSNYRVVILGHIQTVGIARWWQ